MWEPDRNQDEDNKEFITFIVQVEGLSAVPDGRIYMNAYIDAIKGKFRERVPKRFAGRGSFPRVV